MKRAALVVGVNRYDDQSITNLDFAENDAIEVWSFLKYKAGYDDVRKLLTVEDDCILDTAEDLVGTLAPGDLFLFYFAGHGVEHAGQHLLLCPSLRYRRLIDGAGKVFTNHTVAVDLLKQQTARPGLARIFVLDACRRNLASGGRAGVVEGFKGEHVLRDIVTGLTQSESGSLAILCSCGEGRQAQEVPEVEHGLFSHVFLEILSVAHAEGRELRLDAALETQLRLRMAGAARHFGLPGDQLPWVLRSGEIPPLLQVNQQAHSAGVQNSPHVAPQWIFVCSQGMGQFRTIGEALNTAKDGDKIYVLPGTYRESNIAVEKAVELAGQGSEDEPVILESEDDILNLSANGATIRGLCFRILAAQRIAVMANSYSGTISACRFNAPRGTGLLVEGGSRLVIEGCSFENCELGVRIEDASPAILTSKFLANTTGLLVRAGCDCVVENNDFTNNQSASIVIDEDSSASVFRNRFTGSMGNVGVIVKRSSRGSIDHNRFSGLQGGVFAIDEVTEVKVGENNSFE